MNPYHQFVSDYARLIERGKSLPLGGFAAMSAPIFADAAKALIFSPHPDDESITGALALRLLREAQMKIVNVAVTLGSNPARRSERLCELENACRYLGFNLLPAAPNGLEKISAPTRESNPVKWKASAQVIAKILAQQKPRVIFFPHERDWNATHIGTHFLVMDALKSLPPEFECLIVETEFWGAMDTPNLMVESSAADVADLVAAISFHAGEVRRNPFHLRQPAWMQDNVRRGSELIGGQGGAAADFNFATLYRLRKWRRGKLENVFDGGRLFSCRENPAELFA